jgi:hypothetical protein
MSNVIPLRSIHSREGALRYGDEWQRHAKRLEALLVLVEAQRDATQLLLDVAENEVLRLRGLL